uniref:Uncharacterized protein n=1 Tax=Anguilla anguilla TaxID=7936 RepID=A0A0E9UGI8_ANGAN
MFNNYNFSSSKTFYAQTFFIMGSLKHDTIKIISIWFNVHIFGVN